MRGVDGPSKHRRSDSKASQTIFSRSPGLIANPGLRSHTGRSIRSFPPCFGTSHITTIARGVMASIWRTSGQQCTPCPVVSCPHIPNARNAGTSAAKVL